MLKGVGKQLYYIQSAKQKDQLKRGSKIDYYRYKTVLLMDYLTTIKFAKRRQAPAKY